MNEEAVFYFDVLGFQARAAGSAASAIDALSALAQILGTPQLTALTGQWAYRYSLSDSVFLTAADPLSAAKQAGALVFSLVHFTGTDDEPVLVRGALAFGPVRHLRGIFLTTSEAANLVGPAVVDAVRLEQIGLRGPRIIIPESLVAILAARDSEFVKWTLRPTALPGVWEVLWLLPAHPKDLKDEELSLMDVSGLAVQLFKKHEGHPAYGTHYREFLLLAARSVARALRYVERHEAALTIPIPSLLPAREIAEACESMSGLPIDFTMEVRTELSTIEWAR